MSFSGHFESSFAENIQRTNLSIKRSQENKMFIEQRPLFVRCGAITAVVLMATVVFAQPPSPAPHLLFPSEKWLEAEASHFSWKPSTFIKAVPPKNGLCPPRTSEELAEAKLKK